MTNRTRTTTWMAIALAVVLAGGALATAPGGAATDADRVATAPRDAATAHHSLGAAPLQVAPRQPGIEAQRGAKVPFRRFPQKLGDAPTVVLYDNGPLVTHPGGGGGGADASRLQNSSLAMNTLGFGHQVLNNNHMADDFTVTDSGGWQIDTITFYAYQTNSTTTSTMTDIRVQIWDGSPDNPASSVVFGDLVTNVLASTTWTNIYRDSETTIGVTNRPIMEVVATIGTTLPAGTYWIEWMVDGTLASGPWAPPITIIGQTTTGNALQFIGTSATWGPALDSGTATQQGMPFVIEGSVVAPEITLSKTVGLTPFPDCGVDETLSVPAGTDVYYCYTVENTGSVAVNYHTLEDDQIGVIISNAFLTLNPTESVYLVYGPVTIDNTVTNNATWSVTVDPPPTMSTLTVDLNNVNHTWPDDIDMLLVAPAGENLILMSDTGGSTDLVGVNITLDDAAAGLLPNSGGIPSGTYRPTNYGTGDPIPPPAPPEPWGQPATAGTDTLTSIFGGADPNGTWELYVFDQFGGDGGSIGEWCITVQPSGTTVCNSDGIQISAGGGTSGPADPYPSTINFGAPPDASASDSATVTALFPDIAVDPASMSSTLMPGQSDSQVLTIQNNGDAPLNWSLFEDSGLVGDDAPLASTAYSHNAALDEYVTFDVATPDVLNTVAPFAPPGFPGAGEYLQGSVYILDGGGNLAELDAVTGAVLNTLSAPPPAGQTWTGMAVDPTDGTVYAASSTCAVSSLSTIDVTTGAVTAIGPLTNAPCIIGIAVDGNGDLWGYEIVGDVWLSIDKATGAGTVIGPIGFNANFGQGLGWDPATDTLYMAAFNSTTGQPELRTVDRTTGNSTFVGILGSTVPGGTNQLGWIGFEIGLTCSSPQDLPWIGVTQTAGSTPPMDSSGVLVTFYTAGLPNGLYEGLLCIDSNDPDTPTVEVPVSLSIDTMPFIDGFETGDTSRWSFSVP